MFHKNIGWRFVLVFLCRKLSRFLFSLETITLLLGGELCVRSSKHMISLWLAVNLEMACNCLSVDWRLTLFLVANGYWLVAKRE